MIPYLLAAAGGYLIGSSFKSTSFAKGGSVLLAPNGKPSNLTPEQWRLVRTPEFKAWFGDFENDPENASKVVDENGEPLICYHGTKTKFNVFDIQKSGESNTVAKVGFWFTPIKRFAEIFAINTYWGNDEPFAYKVYLSIKKPKIYETKDIDYGDSYERFKTDIYKLSGQTSEDANMYGIGKGLKNEKETINKYRNLLKGKNYDGILIKQTRFDRRSAGGLNDQYVVFEPEQIKLADGSNTTFDADNPDIRYEKGGETNGIDKETYQKWKSLVNMSKSELKRFYESEEGKEAGLSAGEAKSLGIDSGRESARWIMKMKDTPVSEWTPTMWKWAKKQISFISRMKGNKGKLYDDNGKKTRKHTSLLIWGHNPEK